MRRDKSSDDSVDKFKVTSNQVEVKQKFTLSDSNSRSSRSSRSKDKKKEKKSLKVNEKSKK